MEESSIQINLGSVSTFGASMRMAFVVHESGNGHLQIFCHDPTDLRKSSNLFMLGEKEFQELKDLIARVDCTIEKVRGSGQMTKMLPTFK